MSILQRRDEEKSRRLWKDLKDLQDLKDLKDWQDWQGFIPSPAATAGDLDDGSVLCEKPVWGNKRGEF